MTTVICPNCGNQLDKKPTRRRNCPHCGEAIFVRKGVLYTEKQVKDLDFKNRWMRRLEIYGVTEKVYTQVRKKLSRQIGFEASVNDTIWKIINQLITKQNDLQELESIYLEMGEFVKDEGKDPSPYIQQAMEIKESNIKQELILYKKDLGETLNDMSVVVITCNDDLVCSACNYASKI